MYRAYKEEKDGGEKKKYKDPSRPRHRWDLDYLLEPYGGLNPEYMEMSEFQFFQHYRSLKEKKNYFFKNPAPPKNNHYW